MRILSSRMRRGLEEHGSCLKPNEHSTTVANLASCERVSFMGANIMPRQTLLACESCPSHWRLLSRDSRCATTAAHAARSKLQSQGLPSALAAHATTTLPTRSVNERSPLSAQGGAVAVRSEFPSIPQCTVAQATPSSADGTQCSIWSQHLAANDPAKASDPNQQRRSSKAIALARQQVEARERHCLALKLGGQVGARAASQAG